jgi:2-methylcitrate dehydratase PrpD
VSNYPFNNARPGSMQAAQFSAQFAVALALLDVEPGPAWFRKEMYTNGSVLSLMDKISLVPYSTSPECGSGQPNRIPAEATVAAAGRTFDASVVVARGDAKNPLTDEERDRKFHRLASCRLSHDRVDDVLKLLQNLEQENSIDTLVRTLAPAA